MENIVRKGENGGYQHFLIYSQLFLKALSLGSLNVRIVKQRFNSLPNNKIFDWSKLKAFADNKINAT